MRKTFSFLALTILLFTIACEKAQVATQTETASKTETANNDATKKTEPNPAAHDDHNDDAPRITLAEAKKEFDAGTAVFVDTRAAASYNTEHIKGAINVPMEGFEAGYKKIPTDKKIIAYCS